MKESSFQTLNNSKTEQGGQNFEPFLKISDQKCKIANDWSGTTVSVFLVLKAFTFYVF